MTTLAPRVLSPARSGQPLPAERPRARLRRANWLPAAAPWAIFGLALAFRLGSLDLAAFTYDEADAILRARAVARGELALAGALTSWGVPDPPLLIYALALVAHLPSPALASLALMALLNGLAVVATYSLARRFFGPRVALLAGLLYAVNPWAIYFARRAWAEVQPALAVLALWAALEVVEGRRARLAALFFLSLAAAVQARLLALAYVPSALASLILGGQRWFSRWSLLGLLGGGLLSLPYLFHLLATRDQTVAALTQGSRGLAGPRSSVLEFTWWLVAGLNLLPTPAGLASWLDAMRVVLSLESWLAAGLLLAGLAICFRRCIQSCTTWKRYALLLAWAILPLGLLAWQSSTVYLHYLVLLLPLPFLLLALPLDTLLEGARTRWLGLGLFVALALPQATAWIALQRTLMIYNTSETVEARLGERRVLAELARVSAQRIGTGESYGVEVPIRFWQAAADRTRAELAAERRELLVAARGSDPLSEEQPALLEAVLGPDLAPHYQPASSLVVPLGRPALLMISTDVDVPLGPERLGTHRALIPLPTLVQGSRDGIRLLDLPARSLAEWEGLAGTSTRRPIGSFDQQVSFYAFGRTHLGETLDVISLWPGPSSALQPVVALLNANSRLPELENPRRRPVGLDSEHLLLVHHQIPIPARANPGDYRLVVERLGPADPAPPRDLRTIEVGAR